MMWEPFSDELREVIRNAEKVAISRGNNYIGTEHLLISLMNCDDVYSIVGKENDIWLLDIILEADSICGKSDNIVKGEIVFTPRAKEIIELSMGVCRDRKSNLVTPMDMFNAIIKEGESVGFRILSNLGFKN